MVRQMWQLVQHAALTHAAKAIDLYPRVATKLAIIAHQGWGNPVPFKADRLMHLCLTSGHFAGTRWLW